MSVNGTVNVTVPGSYQLEYVATNAAGTQTATRTVIVRDTQAPAITLNGAETVTLECGGGYSDPGATALDSCAGSVAVTPSGTVNGGVPGSYTITYTATDPSGNTATKTRTVDVRDTQKPTITVSGPNPMTLNCRAAYVEPGVSASDTCVGSLGISTSGTVDSSTCRAASTPWCASSRPTASSTSTRSRATP